MQNNKSYSRRSGNKSNSFGSRNNKRRFGNKNFSNRRPNRGRFGRSKRGYSAPKIDILTFINKAKDMSQETVVEENKVKYSELNINDTLMKNIVSKGFEYQTPIQEKVIPIILKGNDVIGLANTGTGKTAAYLIPVLNRILSDRKCKALVLAPTRELALQINAEFMSLRRNTDIFSVVLIGGENMFRQQRSLKQNHNVVVATPGRLLDLINRKSLNLTDFNVLIVDEVDRMLDMGFIEDVKKIAKLMPYKDQNLFFSATLPNKVEDLISQNSKNAQKVDVTKQLTAKNVDQEVMRFSNDQDKIEKLHELLISKHYNKVLIFNRTKHGVNTLEKELGSRGFRVTSLHGNKRQNQRTRAIKDFKNEKVNVLIATDVASRGLDINNISHVINYDIPDSFEDYIHRIGRTGRASNKGTAVTFVKQ